VRPHQFPGVVIDHDREVALPLANRDLVTAVLLVCTVSHATWSSKDRVNPASWRAHGTAATTTP
jgi:hypothetical protein